MSDIENGLISLIQQNLPSELIGSERPLVTRNKLPSIENLQKLEISANSSAKNSSVKVPMVRTTIETTPSSNLVVYTDGCYAVDKKMGPLAAFSIYFPSGEKRNRIEIVEGEQTTFRAEIQAIFRTIQICNDLDKDIEIRTDHLTSIAKLTNIHSLLRFKNQETTSAFLSIIHEYQRMKGNLYFRHVESHNGEYGNQAADKLAKRAMTIASSMPEVITKNTDSEEDFSKLPLIDKLCHKSWKARIMGYEEAITIFKTRESTDPAFKEIYSIDILRKALLDSNAVAHEVGCAMVVGCLENSDSKELSKSKNCILDAIVEKCLGSSRAGTKAKGIEILLNFVELDGKAEIVMDGLIQHLDDKSPKIVAGCVHCMYKILDSFGSSIVDGKQLLKIVPKAFSHSDKHVRQEALQLAIEIHRWFKSSINAIFDQLKPVQVKEIQTLIENSMSDAKPEPTRFSRNKKIPSIEQNKHIKVEEFVVKSPNESSSANITPVVDDYESAIPIDLLSLLDETFYQLFDSQKWKEKKEALDLLEGKLNNISKLEDANYGELVNNLAKKISDLNVLIVIGAAKCLDKMFRASRKHLAVYKGIVLPALIDRLKEKKQQVIESLRSALDNFFVYCRISFTEVLNISVENGFNHKNPLLKSETILFVSRCLQHLHSVSLGISKNDIASVAESCIKCLEDSSPEVRESCFNCLCSLITITGEKAVIPFIEKMDKIKRSKLDEMVKGSKQSSIQSQEISKTLTVTQQPIKKESLTKQIPKPSTSQSNTPSVNIQVAASPSFKYSSPQEAISYIEQHFQIPPQLEDSNWKSRLAAVESLCSSFLTHAINSEVVVTFLSQVKPTWKESNVQILFKMIETISAVATKELSISAAALCLPSLIDKLSDAKLKTVSMECFSNICEKIGFLNVFNQTAPTILAHKNPKVIAESVKLLSNLSSFPLLINSKSNSNFPIEVFLDFCKICSTNANANVRSETVSFLIKLRNLYGKEIRQLLNSFPTNFLSTIDAEFKKTPIMPISTENIEKENVTVESFPESSMPVDTVELDQNLIAQLENPDWKVKKSALDSLHDSIRLETNITTDLISTLKILLSDTNKNIVIQSIDIFSLFCTKSKLSFEKHSKSMLPCILKCLSDSKDQVRLSVLKFLDSFSGAFGMEVLLHPVASFFSSTDNPLFRKELIKWIYENQTNFCSEQQNIPTEQKKALPSLIQIIGVGFSDKNSDIRKLVQQLTTSLCERIGIIEMKEFCKSFSNISSFIETISTDLKNNNVSIKSNNYTQSPVFIDNFPLENTHIHSSRIEKSNSKWNTEVQRIDILREQMQSLFQSSFISQLFSNDSKDALISLSQLEESLMIPYFEDNIKFSCDLLLKIVAWKIFEQNVLVTSKAIELCEKILLFLDAKDLKISEYEANCYLPFIVARLGENKEQLRTKLHEIIRVSCRVYPASKIFIFLVNEGLRNKNAKTRTESLEAMLQLMERHNVLNLLGNSSKIIPQLAVPLSDKDANVRNNCLRLFSFIYSNCNDGISLITKYAFPVLGQKERDFLEERLKRSVAFSSSANDHSISNTSSNSISSAVSSVKNAPVVNLQQHQTFKLDLEEVEAQINKQLAQNYISSSFNFDILLANLTSNDQVKCLDAVNSLYSSLIVSNRIDLFEDKINELLENATISLGMIMEGKILEHSSSLPIRTQVVRKILEMVTRSVKCIDSSNALEISNRAFYLVLYQLILRLVDESLTIFESDANVMMRLFNDSIVTLLENAPKTLVFCSLVSMLTDSCSNLSHSISINISNLTMKCLWKVTRAFSTLLPNEIDPNALLQEISHFYSSLPSSLWSERVNNKAPLGDLPHRTVKALLMELYKIFDESLFALVKEPQMEYVRLSLLSIREKNLQATIDNQKEPSNSVSFNEPPVQFNQQLTLIFSKLTNKNLVQEGLNELYEFKQVNRDNPVVENIYNEHLSKCSSIFQRHIKSQLERIHSCTNLSKSPQPANESKRASLNEDYQEKLNRFKEILGISNASPSSLQIETTSSYSLQKYPDNANDVTQETKIADPTALSVESIKERLSRLKAMNAEISQQVNANN